MRNTSGAPGTARIPFLHQPASSDILAVVCFGVLSRLLVREARSTIEGLAY